MSDHQFAGYLGMTYPHSKDAKGKPIGEVAPGDVRDLDEPLDHNWLPCEGDGDSKPKKAAAKDADSEKASAAKTSGGEKASAGK